MEVTFIQSGKNRKNVHLYLDGKYSLSVDKDVASEYSITGGMFLSEEKIEELKWADLLHRCHHKALSFIGSRPRSELEVRQRLKRCRFDDDVSNETIRYLKGQGLIDDVAFAEYWKENRLAFSPRSKNLIKYELRQKGISNEVVDEIAADVDNEDSAYRAGLKKVKHLSELDNKEFRHKLFTYLRYRGFSYEAIESATDRLWNEINSQ
jgi:regulatory protein